jgi:DNA polymerase III subunit delta
VAQVRLIKGDDPTLVSQALQATVNELLGDGDRSLMVEEVLEEHYSADGDPAIAPLVNAAHTPPFLTEKRIVVGRHVGLFTRAEQVAPLVQWLADPLDTTDLVLVWEKGANSTRLGAVPKSLKEAIKAAGGVEIDAAPGGKARKMLLADRIADAPVRLDGSAKALLTQHLGDEVGRVQSILDALVSTFGEGAALTAADVEPFVGQASDVPPWELTDAIDSGDIATALDKLHRMMRSGDRHPLQILATLHGHYQRALALDGAPVANEQDAAQLLGIKGSTFPAKKALNLSRRLGSPGTRRAMLLLAEADLAVRGGSAIPEDALMDVLVARLAQQARS